ncbi:hypothetical protein T4A_13670 [Trichinella pseudospiralis]|uniref:Uncharacterized protein n=1 Tax=Trichinella pseudospiralis TaxID=6337 RepID=A0A0V1E6K6_TRIPS|nr:hypothetical protein T4A_13670 [Trichinella pseudospiralis]
MTKQCDVGWIHLASAQPSVVKKFKATRQLVFPIRRFVIKLGLMFIFITQSEQKYDFVFCLGDFDNKIEILIQLAIETNINFFSFNNVQSLFGGFVETQSFSISFSFLFNTAVISFKLAAFSEPIVAGEIGVVTEGPPATLPSVMSFNEPAWAPACSGVTFVGFWAGFASSVAGAGSGGSCSCFSSFFPAHNKINSTVITNARMPMKMDTIPKCALFTEGSSKGAIAEKQIKRYPQQAKEESERERERERAKLVLTVLFKRSTENN